MRSWWYFILFVLIVVAIIASLIYFLAVPATTSAKTKWLAWSLGLVGYIAIFGTVMYMLTRWATDQKVVSPLHDTQSQETRKTEKELLFEKALHQLRTNPECKAQHDICLKEAANLSDGHLPELIQLQTLQMQQPDNEAITDKIAAFHLKYLRGVNECERTTCATDAIKDCEAVLRERDPLGNGAKFEVFKEQNTANATLEFCERSVLGKA